jgi:hypothetical protein
MDCKVTCPGCLKSHRVKPSARGKKLRCPTEGCGRIFTVPLPADEEAALRSTNVRTQEAPADDAPTETFRLAVPSQESSAEPPSLHKRVKEPLPAAPELRSADQQVLLPDGRIKAMTMREIREALLQGKINRFSLMRVRDDHGSSGKANDDRAWQPIGFRVFIDPEKEKTYYSKAARKGMSFRDDVATIGHYVFFALGMIAAGIGLYIVKVDLTPNTLAILAAAFVFGNAVSLGLQYGVTFGSPANLLFVAAAFSGLSYAAVRSQPGASVIVAKAGVLAFAGVILFHVTKLPGLLSGIGFDYAWRVTHYDPNDKAPPRESQSRAPSDGYPWMLWKTGGQRRLLRETLAARQEGKSKRGGK